MWAGPLYHIYLHTRLHYWLSGLHTCVGTFFGIYSKKKQKLTAFWNIIAVRYYNTMDSLHVFFITYSNLITKPHVRVKNGVLEVRYTLTTTDHCLIKVVSNMCISVCRRYLGASNLISAKIIMLSYDLDFEENVTREYRLTKV
jgi:hypothetical protein